MQKKLPILFLIIMILALAATGCGGAGADSAAGGADADGSGSPASSDAPDYEIYKYMKISASNSSELYYPALFIFDDPGEVANGDNEYPPCLIAEFDQSTGKATAVKLYAFFLDYEDDEWVNQAIETYEGSEHEDVTSVTKGRVNDFVSYLCAEIDPDSYGYDQYIRNLFYDQNIEKYKDDVYFDNLYNYDTEPWHEEGEGYFEDALSMKRVEWSNSELKPF